MGGCRVCAASITNRSATIAATVAQRLDRLERDNEQLEKDNLELRCVVSRSNYESSLGWMQDDLCRMQNSRIQKEVSACVQLIVAASAIASFQHSIRRTEGEGPHDC